MIKIQILRQEENPLLADERIPCEHGWHFPSENKEENPLLAESSSHFPSENKEDL